MKKLTANRRKYILLLPLLYLALSAGLYRHMTAQINHMLMRQQYETMIVDDVTLMAEIINEADGDCVPLAAIGASHLDTRYQVFAAAYDERLTLLSERTAEQEPFDPLAYPAFIDAVRAGDDGGLTLHFAPIGDMWLYWRWTDTGHLLVAAMSSESVVVPMAAAVTVTQLVNIAITFVLCAGGVLLLARLGYVWDARKGEKWRSRNA